MNPALLRPARFAGTGFEALAGLDVLVRYVSLSFAVTEWTCRERRHSVTHGKHQPWHVLAFVHGGSFRIEGPRGGGVVDPARMVVFRSNEEYSTAHPGCCGDYGSAIALSPDFAAEVGEALARAGGGDPWRRPVRAIDSPLLVRQHELLRRLRQRPPGEPGQRIDADEALFAFVAEALTPEGGVLSPPPSKTQRERVAAAQEILEQRFDRALRLDDLAREVGLSPFQLCRLFRRETGSSVHRYLTRLRVAHGLERLARQPRARLLDLALDLGFDSHSHFTDVFRRFAGRTPSQFRSVVG